MDIFSFFQNMIFVVYICQESLTNATNQKENAGILMFVIIFILNENFDKAFLKVLHFFLIWLYLEFQILQTDSVLVRIELLLALVYSLYNSWFIGKTLQQEKTIYHENKEFLSLYNEIIKNYPSNLISFEKTQQIGGFPFDLKFSNDSAKKEFNIIDNPSLSKLLEDVHLNTDDLLNFDGPQELMTPGIPDATQTKRLLDTCVSHEDISSSEKTNASIKKFLTSYNPKRLGPEEKSINYRILLVRFCYKKKIVFLLNMENTSLEEEIIHLKQMDKIKDDTLASITHDLRSPLSSMLKWIEYAKESTDFEESQKHLELAANNGNMLMSLINDILDYSLIRNGKFKLNYTKFLLENLIQESINLMKIQADFKEIKMVLSNKCPKNLFLTSDFTRIKQIIYNLIGNSIKFCRRGGQIDLDFSLVLGEKNHIKIQVSDNGVGIKPEIIPKLCQPFHTYDNNGNYNRHGVGLGLHICKTIIGQLGPVNKLDIESEYEHGSSFTFLIYINCLQNPNKNKFISSDQLQEYQKNKIQEQIIRSNQDFLIEIASLHSKDKIPSDEFMEIKSLKNLPYHKELATKPSMNIPDVDVDNIMISENKDTILENEMMERKHTPFTSCTKNEKNIEFQTQFINSFNKPINLPPRILDEPIKLHILVADDDGFNQLIMKTIFSKFKFEHAPIKLQIEQVFQGEEALKMFKSQNIIGADNPFELIFMDCLMPIKDGFTTTQEIKSLIEDGNFTKCKIIGCTSLQDQEKCLLFGMDHILIKPVENVKIFEILNQIFLEKLLN